MNKLICVLNNQNLHQQNIQKIKRLWLWASTSFILLSQLANRLEEVSNQNMTTLLEFLQTWKLKLSHSKTVTATFHLNNRAVKRELAVYSNNNLLPSRTCLLTWSKPGQISHVPSSHSGIATNWNHASHCWGELHGQDRVLMHRHCE